MCDKFMKGFFFLEEWDMTILVLKGCDHFGELQSNFLAAAKSEPISEKLCLAWMVFEKLKLAGPCLEVWLYQFFVSLFFFEHQLQNIRHQRGKVKPASTVLQVRERGGELEIPTRTLTVWRGVLHPLPVWKNPLSRVKDEFHVWKEKKSRLY